jgi:hypothetical protein
MILDLGNPRKKPLLWQRPGDARTDSKETVGPAGTLVSPKEKEKENQLNQAIEARDTCHDNSLNRSNEISTPTLTF